MHSGLSDLAAAGMEARALLARGRKKPVPGPGTGRQGECGRGQDDSASCCGKGRTAETDNSQAGRMRLLRAAGGGWAVMEWLET